MNPKKLVLDLYFYVGVLIFAFGKSFDSNFLDFYLYFNIFGLLLVSFYLISDDKNKFNFRGMMFLGLVFYLFGNLIFINDFNLYLFNLSDIFFIIQIVTKQISIIYLRFPVKNFDILKNIILFNLFVLLTSIFTSKLTDNSVLDLFYFIESLFSMLIILYFNFFNNYSYIFENLKNIELFYLAQVFWLIGDIFYSDLNLNNNYTLGDTSDLIYFIGLYFFIKSLSQFNLNLNLNLNIVKRFI